jgi:hypothetical protein
MAIDCHTFKVRALMDCLHSGTSARSWASRRRQVLAACKCSPHASAHHSARALFTPSSQVPRARSARVVTTALVAALGDERYVDRECGPTRDAGGRESLRAVLLSRAELWVQPHLLHLRLPSQLSSESPACSSRSPACTSVPTSRRPSSLCLGHTAVLGPEGSHHDGAPEELTWSCWLLLKSVSRAPITHAPPHDRRQVT